MPEVFYNDHPTISDTVLFNLTTTDSSGVAINPYKVNVITIYFIERGFTSKSAFQYDTQYGNNTFSQYFSQAVPNQVFGTSDFPAWIGTDTSDAFVTKLDFDDSGNPLTGVFQLQWIPRLSLAREGDYVLCYSWTPIAAGDVLQGSITFNLFGDTKQTTSLPTHVTVPDKYETLLERYTPEMFKMSLYPNGTDLSPDVINRLNTSVASAFTDLENLGNSILDLIDANAIPEAMLPYLGNLFALRLKSDDVTLWRRQIKEAIPLFKRKGTLGALQEALAAADVTFIKFTKLWQVVSSATWQEGFVITLAQEKQSSPVEFVLAKLAILPPNTTNYSVKIRFVGDSTYTNLTLDYVTFSNSNGETTMTWVGDQLSMNPISLVAGDVVLVLYEYAVPVNQSIENYIRTLPLADQRDETEITFPLKNWNVRVIAEDDAMFDAVIPTRHPFHYPVVFGKVRTEFPYSENIYNMEEYNGRTDDSKNPCDLDKSFLDSCSACLGSKFTIDIEVENLSASRLVEAEEVINDYKPFHAVVHSINYTGSQNEFFPSPQEEIEVLGTIIQNDNVIATQMDFNRLIVDGSSDANTLKRNMLASYNTTAASGTGTNVAIVLFSPGIQFDTLGISNNNFLEILSGSDQGKYTVSVNQKFTVDVNQGSPSTIGWPLDTSSFPFRLSNLLYNESSASVYSDYVYKFSDSSVVFIDYGLNDGWKVKINSGAYAGTYTVSSINSDGTISINSFPSNSVQFGLNYSLIDTFNIVKFTGTTGKVTPVSRGRVQMDLVAEELGFRVGDYILFNGTQYTIIEVLPRAFGATHDTIYIDAYAGGNVVGTASISAYRRLIDNAVGYLAVRGLSLTGTVPTISTVAETNQFQDNYLIQIGSDYYQIDSINGSKMILNGPLLQWGLTGTAVSYTILQFIKTSPISSESGPYQGASQQFFILDRRGNDSFEIVTDTSSSMAFNAAALNQMGGSQPLDIVGAKENIWVNVEYK
jgi:hypothetical protein